MDDPHKTKTCTPNWIRNRDLLGEYLNAQNLTGLGVEVGVHEGKNAHTLCSTWKGQCLFLVDEWDHDPGWYDTVPSSEMARVLQVCVARLVEPLAEGKSRLVKMASLQAAAWFETKGTRFDFVYIDANHKYEYVKQDIAAWAPLVRSGGLLCGHDYILGVSPVDGFDYGVRQAVHEFADPRQLSVLFTVDDLWPSWGILLP